MKGRDRCNTYMLAYFLTKKDDGVTLQIVKQTDYKLPWIVNLFGVLGKTYFVTWMTQLKAVVEGKA